MPRELGGISRRSTRSGDLPIKEQMEVNKDRAKERSAGKSFSYYPCAASLSGRLLHDCSSLPVPILIDG